MCSSSGGQNCIKLVKYWDKYTAMHGQQNVKILWRVTLCYFVWIVLCVIIVRRILCILDRASSWYLNNGWPTRWHLLYYILLNMFQTLIRPSSGASEYLLCCVDWLEACWCYVAGLSVGDVVSECRLNHITNRQSRYITPARLKSAYTTQQVLASSWRWTY